MSELPRWGAMCIPILGIFPGAPIRKPWPGRVLAIDVVTDRVLCASGDGQRWVAPEDVELVDPTVEGLQ
jgi:hypothetical protein